MQVCNWLGILEAFFSHTSSTLGLGVMVCVFGFVVLWLLPLFLYTQFPLVNYLLMLTYRKLMFIPPSVCYMYFDYKNTQRSQT